MALDRIINLLQTAHNPARSLDVAIGTAIGWRKMVKSMPDSSGIKKDVTVWTIPNSDDIGKLPLYTSNLQHAFELAEYISPSSFGGCSWVDGKGTARINDGPYFEACNPQIALCIAALHLLNVK